LPPINLKIHKRIFNDNFFPLLFDYSSRYLVLFGGAGSGKSHFSVQRIVIKAIKGKRKILFIRKVAATLKDSIYDLVITTLRQFQLLDLCIINKTTYTVELPNGSIFLFKGLDSNEKMKSITDLTDIVVEEATELTYEDFLQLDLRLRHPFAADQEIVLMFNPVSKANWCYKHWFVKPPPNAKINHSTYKNNRFLPQSNIDAIESMAIYNEAYYKVYALGEFASLDKLIFPNFTVAAIASDFLNKQKVCGSDFGFTNDATTGIEVYYDKDSRTIYITDEFYGKAMTTQDIYQTIIQKGFNNYPIVGDSAEPRMIAELRQKGIQIVAAKKGKDSILHGITWLQGNHIVVDTKCIHIIEEFQNYTWQKDKSTNEYLNTPIDEYNHCIDALRYATERYATGNAVRTLSKSALGI
jgi:phage terminase large subunit